MVREYLLTSSAPGSEKTKEREVFHNFAENPDIRHNYEKRIEGYG